MVEYPWLAKCAKVTTSMVLKIHLPLAWAVKSTLYKQSVGGETLQDYSVTTNRLMKYDVESTFDYSTGNGQAPEGIQATLEETLRPIDLTKGNTNLAYAVSKPSMTTADELLAKVSEKREELTINDVRHFREFRECSMVLCQRAYDNDIRISVDAEDYCFQDTTDVLTDEAICKFNKKRAIVFATLQMRRHDRMPYLRRTYDDTVMKGYVAGMRSARGAYMETERARVVALDYPDPICRDEQATDENCDTTIRFTIDYLDRLEMFMETHNEESNYKLAKLMGEKGITRNDPCVFFAQLLGVSDNISFNLTHARYSVTKHVPYASIRGVLPYLIRRAEESTSVAGRTNRELRMLEMEMTRRKEHKPAEGR